MNGVLHHRYTTYQDQNPIALPAHFLLALSPRVSLNGARCCIALVLGQLQLVRFRAPPLAV